MYCVVCRLLLSLLLSSARLDLLLMCLVACSLVDRLVGSFASFRVILCCFLVSVFGVVVWLLVFSVASRYIRRDWLQSSYGDDVCQSANAVFVR